MYKINGYVDIVNNYVKIASSATIYSSVVLRPIDSTCFPLARRKRGDLAFMRWTWALRRGLDSDLVAQFYMITKKLTLNIFFKSTKKNIP